jgi:ribosomal protein L35AE/L33A
MGPCLVSTEGTAGSIEPKEAWVLQWDRAWSARMATCGLSSTRTTPRSLDGTVLRKHGTRRERKEDMSVAQELQWDRASQARNAALALPPLFAPLTLQWDRASQARNATNTASRSTTATSFNGTVLRKHGTPKAVVATANNAVLQWDRASQARNASIAGTSPTTTGRFNGTVLRKHGTRAFGRPPREGDRASMGPCFASTERLRHRIGGGDGSGASMGPCFASTERRCPRKR